MKLKLDINKFSNQLTLVKERQRLFVPLGKYYFGVFHQIHINLIFDWVEMFLPNDFEMVSYINFYFIDLPVGILICSLRCLMLEWMLLVLISQEVIKRFMENVSKIWYKQCNKDQRNTALLCWILKVLKFQQVTWEMVKLQLL